MEGLSVASAEDDSAADGGGGASGNTGGGGGGGGAPSGRSEETRRCNAPRAARPPVSLYETGGGVEGSGRGGGGGGCGGHNRKINQQQQRHQQQQQQQQQQHGGGKKQKKQQKWKANKYRGRGGPDRKDCPARGGRKDKSTGGIGSQNVGAIKPEDGTAANGLSGEEQMTVGKGIASGEAQAHQSEPGCFHQVNQQQGYSQHGSSSSGNAQQQTSGALTTGVAGQQGTGGGTAISSIMPPQKQKHSKQQNLTPMEVRNKRLQSVSKFFLPDKRPRKECIVPPTKFLLGGNISDPLNLNSLQNESENAVTPKSSPIPTPPHYKAKIEVIIPPNINDPLHLLDPVDSVEYEMQLCSPMKRKQRTRNKRKRKSRTATERNADGLLSIDQLPPPPGAEENVGSSGATGGGANKAEEATTAEEASFTGIGQKLADAAAGERFSLAPDTDAGPHFHHHHYAGQSSSSGGNSLAQQGHINTAGVGTSVGTSTERNVSTAGSATEQDRDREKAMRNLKLDLESAGGRKRRTSESTNSTKNKLRRMDSMDKIVSPVIPQPGGWKRAHWPTNAGGSGAVGNAGRNRTRTYSTTSNTDELHGEEATTSTDFRGQVQESQVQEKAHHSERNDASVDLTKQVLETGSSTVREGVITGGGDSVPVLHTPGDDIGAVERPLALVQGTAEGAIPQPHSALASSSGYHFGNYDRYYGYHSLNEFIDVRLKVFLRNSYLFRDKDVLDIGCNVGLMTIAVAKMLHPKSATGIDVDGKLVSKARKNLSKYVRIPRNAGHSQGRRANRESATVVSTAAATMEVSGEANEGRNTIPLECDPLQLGVSEPVTTVVAATTSQTGQESIAPIAATPLSVAESAVAEVPGVNEPPGENMLQSPVVLAQTAQAQEEATDIKPPETVDQTGQIKSELVATVAAHGSKYLLRQKRRRKRMAQKRRPGQHHHHHQHQQLRRQKTEQSQYFPISFPLTMGNLSGKEFQMDIGRTENKFPHNVRFKTMNYVLKDESLINYDTQQYDLILCLSVTKWIHLNYGDMGLKIAFKRMFNHLRPGGKLILEAQNIASYKKKMKLTPTIFKNYKSIELMPSRFHDYLLSPEVGFSHSLPLGIPRHLSKGFRRPILLYIKGDFTPSQAKWSDTYHPGTPYENHRGIYTDIVTASQSAAGCIWGAMTPYAPSYSYRQPPTPSHGGGSGSGSGGFASTSPYYNPRQTDSYLPSYDNIGNGHRPGSYCFASPLYSTTWSPPSDMLATSGGGGGSYRRSASNTPNSASIRSTDNDEHYYAGTVGGGSQRRHHVYPPIDVLPPLVGYDGMRPGSYRSGGGGGGGGATTDSDSEPSSNSASQTPTRQQQLAGSFLTDDQSNSPSGHSQPDK
ncbi:7SK snRNA methylphosphate capping enzyme bin3 [Anopheles marshallii]|uniref:7SK snRNA methylphosphate capping enzyme bin3 n=1 Tax=Anopheles marshallii TaxID=1521116 RepID=UPI00237C1C39|nr:7SK snRNA methylphosphate capping enzyme bin3 [Anopheles marshallii]